MLVVADSFALTNVGRQRRANEDAYFERRPLFAVADGMGGAQAGEVASRIAVEVLQDGLPDGGAAAEERLASMVQDANEQIHELSRSDEERAGMGTTLTAAYVGEEDLAIAHVGDSRLYCLRAGVLERLTRDHSLVEELVQEGKLTPEQADEHPQRSIITRALGPERDVLVDHMTWRAQPGDVYLLCSDGLTSMIPESSVGELVRGAGTLREAAHALVDAANAAGGRDNITVVLFRTEDAAAGPGGAASSSSDATLAGGELRAADVRSAVAESPRPDARRSSAHPALAEDTEVVAPRVPRSPGSDGAPGAEARRGRGRARRTGKALFITVLVLLPLLMGGYIASQSVWFVGTNDDGFVTLFRGMPYDGPFGVDAYTESYVSSVPSASLPPAVRRTVAGHELRSREDAADLITQLERGTLTGQGG